MRKRVAHEQALWYEEELNKEIEKDRLAHGKKAIEEKKMITSHLHPVEPEMIRILYLKNFLKM